MLTNAAILKAKPGDKPFKLTDGRGLHLVVLPSGSKSWRYKYRHGGKEKLLTLGSYPDMSLAQARQAHEDERRKLQAGDDPSELRKATKLARQLAADNSFKAVACAWWESWRVARSPRHALQVMNRLEADVFPAIGHRPVSEVQPLHLVALMKAIAKRGAVDIAARAVQTCGQVFRYAVAHGMAARNPATDIKPGDVLPSRRTVNFARVDAAELPELLRAMEAYQGTPATRLAMRLMVLTFVRTSELIEAKWGEFDLERCRWDIPAERMKMKTPQIVPLSSQAIGVLKTLQLVSGNREYIFPGERNPRSHMSNGAILMALRRMGYAGKMTGHGFRGIASTVLHEHGFEHVHIELQLAHQERNSVSASYNHATYLQQREKMMQWWGDYVDNCSKGKS